MSLSNVVKACTRKSESNGDRKIANMVRKALRQDFPIVKLAAQAIAQEIDVNFNAVNRWYNGLNAPVSWHFLMLMKVSPSLFAATIQEIGSAHFTDEIGTFAATSKVQGCNQIGNRQHANSVPINEPINGESRDSVLRQRWFVDQIQKGICPSISSIVEYWKVSRRKAKDDIAALKKRGAIAFVGAKKNGHYVLL